VAKTVASHATDRGFDPPSSYIFIYLFVMQRCYSTILAYYNKRAQYVKELPTFNEQAHYNVHVPFGLRFKLGFRAFRKKSYRIGLIGLAIVITSKIWEDVGCTIDKIVRNRTEAQERRLFPSNIGFTTAVKPLNLAISNSSIEKICDAKTKHDFERDKKPSKNMSHADHKNGEIILDYSELKLNELLEKVSLSVNNGADEIEEVNKICSLLCNKN
jgi:hypothetical protein